MKFKTFFIPFIALSFNQVALAEPLNSATSPASLAWQCAACHGTNGQEFTEAMPSLAGMPAEQIIESMMAFKKGTRPAIIMDRVSRGYTDDEIKTMAYFFTKQPLKQWDDTTLAESVAAQAAGSIGAPK